MFNLPQTSAEQAPAFTTAAECRTWLESQPLANVVQAQAQLLRSLNTLNRYALPATERLAILELLREPVQETQDENVRKFSGKPLPLAPPEQAAYETSLSIWSALTTGYLHCLAACLAGDKAAQSLHSQLPLIAQRALAALIGTQTDICRGGRQPPAEHWRTLHQIFQAAEKAGVLASEVEDRLRMGKNPATPAATWAEAMLLQAASPYELPLRQLGWVARWARRWSGKIELSSAPPPPTRALPLCVNLDGDRPAGYATLAGPGVRFLATSGLRESLKKRVVLLERGESPASLQLGDDCSQPQCGQLLVQMYYRWCKGGAIRRHERRPATGPCQLIGNVEAIFYYLSGRKPFQQPNVSLSDTQIRKQREEIATFGRATSVQPVADDYSKQHGFMVEQWEVMEEWHLLDQSATGVRITRPVAKAGARFGGGQLAAVRPADAKTLFLGSVRWAMIDTQDALQAGVYIIPGKPEPISVRGTGLAAVREKYSPAFLLPAVAPLQEPASIVIPSGWFKIDRVLEVYGDHPYQVRLQRLLDRGSDFERATYEVLTNLTG